MCSKQFCAKTFFTNNQNGMEKINNYFYIRGFHCRYPPPLVRFLEKRRGGGLSGRGEGYLQWNPLIRFFFWADVCLISALFEPSSLSEDLLRETPNLNRYVSTVGNLDSVRKVFGNLKETAVLDCSSEFSEQANIGEIRDKLRTEELSGIWPQLKQFTLWKVHYRYSE